MQRETLKELYNGNFLTKSQYEGLDVIVSRKIVSVFYELRIMLYLGVMLFATGIGLLIYENIGEWGHILSILVLTLTMARCFRYAFQHGLPYRHDKVLPPSPYFDYFLLLGCLLLITVLGYLQIQFGILDKNLGISTLVTAFFFFYIAYRFDHLGILSMAITALASFWSITLSPRKWYSPDFFSSASLYNTALIFSALLGFTAIVLDRKKIKSHFTFTYLNFCLLIFFIGALTGMFSEASYLIYLFLLYAACAFAIYVAKWKKSFLFLLYAFISGYIGTTYFLLEVFPGRAEWWFLYMICSCGGFIFFIVRYRNYFSRTHE